MKFQSILINSNKDLTIEELKNFLESNVGIKGFNSINMYEIAPIKSNSINISQVKEISQWINLKNKDTKFVVIRSAENLTMEAQNSLLKNLEEPNENTLFILISINSEIILETIKSRCLIFNLNNASRDEENNPYKEIAEKFYKADYLERLKIVEKLLKDYDNRDEIANIVFEIIKVVPVSDSYESNIKIIKSVYVGIKRNVNLKLSLNLLAIYIK